MVVLAPVFTKVPLFFTNTDWLVKFCQLISASSLIVKVPRLSRVVLPPLPLDNCRVAPLKLRVPSLINCRPPSRDLPEEPLMVAVASGGITRLPVPVIVPPVHENESVTVRPPIPVMEPLTNDRRGVSWSTGMAKLAPCSTKGSAVTIVALLPKVKVLPVSSTRAPAAASSVPVWLVVTLKRRLPLSTRIAPVLETEVGSSTVVVPAPVFTKVPLFFTNTDWLVKFCQLISASSLIVKVPRLSRVVLPPLPLDSSKVAPLKLRVPSLINCRPPSRDLPEVLLIELVADVARIRLPVPVIVPPDQFKPLVIVSAPVPLRVPPLIVNDGASIAVFTVRPPETISIPSENVAAALSVRVPPVKRIPPFVEKVAPLAIVKPPDDKLMIEPALPLSAPECAVCVANCRAPEFTRNSPLLVS